MNKLWYYWVIKNVRNPDSYIAGNNFSLIYLKEDIIKWQYNNDLHYFISEAPAILKLRNITLSNFNIKSAS